MLYKTPITAEYTKPQQTRHWSNKEKRAWPGNKVGPADQAGPEYQVGPENQVGPEYQVGSGNKVGPPIPGAAENEIQPCVGPLINIYIYILL